MLYNALYDFIGTKRPVFRRELPLPVLHCVISVRVSSSNIHKGILTYRITYLPRDLAPPQESSSLRSPENDWSLYSLSRLFLKLTKKKQVNLIQTLDCRLFRRNHGVTVAICWWHFVVDGAWPSSPVSIQTQSLALRKWKPQETQVIALASSQSWLPLLWPSIPIGCAYATHATQAIAFGWKPGFSHGHRWRRQVHRLSLSTVI